MQLIVVSPESEYADEASVIVRLLDAGLTRYHLRKPDWTAAQCADLLAKVPQQLHTQLSIHQCYELADSHAVSIHLKDNGSTHSLAKSRSLHDLQSIADKVKDLDYAFLSPIFPSITKTGYVSPWIELELRDALRGPRELQFYALGGITTGTAERALDLGFDGVVLHGTVWQSADPVQAFQSFRKEAA